MFHSNTCGRSTRAQSGCGKNRDGCRWVGHFEDLTAIIADYRRNGANDSEADRRWYGDPKLDFADAIVRACRAEGEDGKVHSHQRRIGRRLLTEILPLLGGAEDLISKANSFDDVYDVVWTSIGNVGGIGDLTVYDIAQRIGWYRGLAPDRIYLHAGTREGARALCGADSGKFLNRKRLPRLLRKLSAAEIEEVFCIYKKDFARINAEFSS